MNFNGRLALVIVGSVLCIFIIFDPLEIQQDCSCKNSASHDRLMAVILDHPLMSKDIIVVSDGDRNKSFEELSISRFKEIGKELQHKLDRIDSSGILGRKDAVLNCITWDVVRFKADNIALMDAFPQNFVYNKVKGEEDTLRIQRLLQIHLNHIEESQGLRKLKFGLNFTTTLHMVIGKIKEITKKQALTIVDISCTEFEWIQMFLEQRNDVNYVCLVPAQNVTAHLLKLSKFDGTKLQIVTGDVTQFALHSSVDLIVCVNLFSYLWAEDISKTLYHISRSGSKYALFDNFREIDTNADFISQATLEKENQYNLELRPFLLEPPICSTHMGNFKELSLWKVPLQQVYSDST